MVIQMREIMIDCAGLSPAELHDTLARELEFPAWYGRNLDALYDCLTEICTDTALTLQHLEYEGFLLAFLDAAMENPHLHITVE